MILSFRDKETELIWSGIRVKKLPLEIQNIRINDQWRILFQWSEGQSEHVKIIDYY